MNFLRRHWALLTVLCIAVILVAFPAIDLTTAGWLYDPFDGFYLHDNPLVRFVYATVPWITRSVLVSLLLFLLASWTLLRRKATIAPQRRIAVYLLLVMILGPGLLVNTVFKDNWGRARPSQVEQFGGEKEFSRAAIPTNQCAKNCSFVSGHASVGFYFLAIAFVWPRRRVFWLVTGTALGLGIGLVRMMQGGHFLSDVIFCGIVVYAVAWGLHRLLFHDSDKTRTA